MLSPDLMAPLVLGAIFTILGLIAVALWIREARGYDYQLMRRLDAREFLTRWPERPWLQAWRIGSWILLVVGVLLIIAVAVIWRSGL